MLYNLKKGVLGEIYKEKCSSWLFFLLILINSCILISDCIFYTFYSYIQNCSDTVINIHETTIFNLPTGIGPYGLGFLLIKQKIIKSTDTFQWLMKVEPRLAQFKAGTYRLNPGMSLREMLEMFFLGKEAQFSLQFIEGSCFADWRKLLHRAPYLKHMIDNQSLDKLVQDLGLTSKKLLEGSFYPDTYYYTAGMSDIDILKRAHQKMLIILEYEWQLRAANLPYKTPYEMLIMASIIEKETSIDTERAIIASVFINRLKKNMRLQTDPTVIYGLGDKYRGTLYRSDLNKSSLYNTYLIFGLPPSPIAMPSRSSIKAAAHPNETDYLYFVATGKGGHIFTTNINDHNQAVKNYRQIQMKVNE